MEFFAIADIETTPDRLRAIPLRELGAYCDDIDEVIAVEGEQAARVYCVWGEFRIERQVINGGVRFSMPDCPNAMSWTLTTGFDPAPGRVVVHATINRVEHDPDFIESIEDWVTSWREGLERQGMGRPGAVGGAENVA